MAAYAFGSEAVPAWTTPILEKRSRAIGSITKIVLRTEFPMTKPMIASEY